MFNDLPSDFELTNLGLARTGLNEWLISAQSKTIETKIDVLIVANDETLLRRTSPVALQKITVGML